jgi:two-component system response regulator (stage 0 sporulation protein F)
MSSAGRSILIVDDNDDVRDLLLHFLASDTYRLYSANNSDSALALLESEKIDLVLLDVMMPGISGVQLLKKIRASHVGSNPNLPVIMVTARSGSDDIEEAMEAGAHSYIIKPFRGEEIRRQVADVLALEEERAR